MWNIEALKFASELLWLLHGILPTEASLNKDGVEVSLGGAGAVLTDPRPSLGPLATFSAHTEVCPHVMLTYQCNVQIEV